VTFRGLRPGVEPKGFYNSSTARGISRSRLEQSLGGFMIGQDRGQDLMPVRRIELLRFPQRLER
jgi:hypothetical protein